MNRRRCSIRWCDCFEDLSVQSRQFSERIYCRPRSCWIWVLHENGVRCVNNTSPGRKKNTIFVKSILDKKIPKIYLRIWFGRRLRFFVFFLAFTAHSGPLLLPLFPAISPYFHSLLALFLVSSFPDLFLMCRFFYV